MLETKKGRVIAMEADVEVMRVGPDPFGRGWPTVFYRDYRIDGGREEFYLAVHHWAACYPNIPLLAKKLVRVPKGELNREIRLYKDRKRKKKK